MDERLLYSLCSGRGGQFYGYRVSDLTLKHLLGLFVLDSPYALGGDVADEDVVLAARLFASGDDVEWMAALGGGGWWERVGGFFKGLRYGRRDRRVREREKLEEWLEGEMLVPRVLPGGSVGRKLKIHWLLHLVSNVMRECGCGMREAWWMRFSDVAWVKLSWDEMDGREFTLLSDDLVEEFRELGWSMEELGL